MQNNQDERPVLTIAIPTFNRAFYLEKSLNNIIPQIMVVNSSTKKVELLVSDNASKDNTEEIVKKFCSNYGFIRYNRNVENLGPDRNFLTCINLANGKFTLLIGDDDTLIAGALKGIVETLEKNLTMTIIMINGYRSASPEARSSSAEPLIIKNPSQSTYFKDKDKFLKSITIRAITFMSCIIYNTNCLHLIPNLEEGAGTHFIQTFWLLKALSLCPNSLIIPFPWISQGNAEPTLLGEIDSIIKSAGQYSEQGTLIVHLQFYSIYLPKICKDYKYKFLTSSIVFSKYIIWVSLSMLFDKLFKNSTDIISRATIYKYTRNNKLAWVIMYPVMLLPVPLIKFFKPFSTKLFNAILYK